MPRVLVADDADALRLVVRITVESQGWSVLEAASGIDALRTATAEHPDLIILDLDFGDPTLDGIEVCRRIRTTPATADVPVIVLTASGDPRDQERATAAGADLYMAKPFGPIELLEAIRQVLHQYLSGAGLGLYLVDAGVLPPGVLQEAVARQRTLAETDQRVQLGALLTDMGAITEADLTSALRRQRAELGVPREDRR